MFGRTIILASYPPSCQTGIIIQQKKVMIMDTSTETIRQIFYKQVRDMTLRSLNTKR